MGPKGQAMAEKMEGGRAMLSKVQPSLQEETKGLRMASWNICRGLHAKEQEITAILVQNKLDILHLQETDIEGWSSSTFCIPGFITFTHEGEKKRAVTLLRNTLGGSVTQRTDLAQGRPEVWLEFLSSKGKKVIVGNIYREHGRGQKGTTNKGLTSELADVLQSLAEEGWRLVIAGDFNMDLHDGQTTYSRLFRDRIREAGFDTHGFGKTFFRLVKESVWESNLDWLITSRATVGDTWKRENGASDHHIIGWTLKSDFREEKKPAKWARNLKHLEQKREKFLCSLASHPWEDLAQKDIEEQAWMICQRLVQSLDEVAPKKKMTIRRKCPVPSEELRNLRRSRDNARSKGDQKMYKRLRNRVVLISRQERQSALRKRIDKEPNQVWSVLNELQGNSEQMPSKMVFNGRELRDEEAPEYFNEAFIEKVKTIKESLKSVKDTSETTQTRATLLGLKSGDIKFGKVTEKDVMKVIKEMKPSKAVDMQGISPFVLKLAAPVLATPLAFVIGGSLAMAKVPKCWKEALIHPLHKKKSKKQMQNYRPVSILSTPSKVLAGDENFTPPWPPTEAHV